MQLLHTYSCCLYHDVLRIDEHLHNSHQLHINLWEGEKHTVHPQFQNKVGLQSDFRKDT